MNLPGWFVLAMVVGCGPALEPGPTSTDGIAPPAGVPDRSEAPEMPALERVVRQSDVIVVGRAISFRPPVPTELHEILVLKSFDAVLPRYAHPRVDVRIADSLRGNLSGEIAFYRLSALTLATEDIERHTSRLLGEDRIFILRRAPSGVLWAEDSVAVQPLAALDEVRALAAAGRSEVVVDRAVAVELAGRSEAEMRRLVATHGRAAVPAIRRVLLDGSVEERAAVAALAIDYGLVPLMPELIDRVTDGELYDPPGHVPPSPIGNALARAIARIAWLVDDVDEMRRRDAFFFRDPDGAARAQSFWHAWWDRYRASGPVESATLLAR